MRDRWAKVLPFLLQGGKVFFEGWADLVEQLHQGMAEEAGAGRLGVEVVYAVDLQGDGGHCAGHPKQLPTDSERARTRTYWFR